MGPGARLRPVLIRMLEGRVGSTLLMQLLGTAPEIAFDRVYPYENSYLTYSLRLAQQIGGPRPADRRVAAFLRDGDQSVGPPPFPATDLDCVAIATRSLSGIWEAFSVGLGAQHPAARLYAEKFWGDVGAVTAAGLDPIVVDLIRDPRDVIASIRAFNAQTGIPRFGRADAVDDADHLRRLVLGMGLRLAEFDAEPEAQRITLRYEDLIRDVGGTVERLERTLGVRLAPEEVRRRREEVRGHMTASSEEASIGRWREDLAPGDVARIERRLAGPMRAFGYPLSSNGAADSSTGP